MIERTHAWTDVHNKLIWCTERRVGVLGFWLTFAAVLITAGRLVREAWTHYQRDDRPRRKP